MHKRVPLILLALFPFLIFSGAAYAHKVKIFAWAEGSAITGYVYFSGGARARNTAINIMGPDNWKMGETVTNEKGEFAFEALLKCDHRLVADAGDGHRAEYTVPAHELPDDLALFNAQADQSRTPQPLKAADVKKTVPLEKKKQESPATVSESELIKMVEKAVSKQLRPLRVQIEQYEEKTRLHDILGGIGYILGLMGLTFYLKARRRTDTRQP